MNDNVTLWIFLNSTLVEVSHHHNFRDASIRMIDVIGFELARKWEKSYNKNGIAGIAGHYTILVTNYTPEVQAFTEGTLT